MPRLLATALLALALTVGVVVGPAGPAGAQGESTTTSAVPTDDIIPEPNSGRAPEDAGDRGGALQSALFVGLVLVVVGATVVLVRQSRRARAERGF